MPLPLPDDLASLHPETQALLLADAKSDQISYEDAATVEEARILVEGDDPLDSDGYGYEFRGERLEYTVPSTQGEADLPVWVYRPVPCPPKPTILVYFHGGGFVIGNRKTHEIGVKILTDLAACIMVSVEYRRAPEHKFPAAFDDAETAVKWVFANKELIGGSKDSKVGVMGDSAGGNLSASLAHDIPGLALQILTCPVTDWRGETESYKKFATGYFMSAKQMEWFANHTFNSVSERSHPRASPLLREKFNHLPPALYIAASHDVLIDEGMAYAKKLKDAGVPVEVLCLQGVTHVFFNLPGIFKENHKLACEKIKQFISTYGQ
ncbi:AB hydrolase superfamily protein C1039.03-like [Lingula anatina]|uniref:AB hydrolase superfamily protein C1039.03-like n=1 Tax=Lingula anatina TaxID=7574 RepID=A0A1S3KI80_LINAN|nr:AB hydrolase superfamily protein C1039.03-like [Lingula anatina]|eukprot:XP_013422184.1 AB hydrolase superfamily protein C1039.03-like [Lingula anatina]